MSSRSIKTTASACSDKAMLSKALVRKTKNPEFEFIQFPSFSKITLSNLGNYQGSIESYSDAIEVDKESRKQAFMKRGILYLQLGQNKKGDQFELK